MSIAPTSTNVTGHIKRLDDTRLVYLGNDPAYPDRVFIGFRNRRGKDTKLTLSHEAFEALVALRDTPPHVSRVEFPHKMKWQLATGTKESE